MTLQLDIEEFSSLLVPPTPLQRLAPLMLVTPTLDDEAIIYICIFKKMMAIMYLLETLDVEASL